MDYRKKYNRWLEEKNIDEKTKSKLLAILENQEEIKSRFCDNLTFGTGGLRGVIGEGSNRMNVYVVRHATQGLANYLLRNENYATQGVAIAYDSRNYSDIFAKQAALVLCAAGIKTYLFDELRPTPELSYTVRKLKCAAGIVITASHNPAKYNGYKVYGSDGGQITPKTAKEIMQHIKNIDIFDDVKIVDETYAVENGLLKFIGEEIDEKYIDDVISLSLNDTPQNSDIKIVYTSLHGSGFMPISRMLKKLGYRNIRYVKQQVEPDGDFPTVKSPNPEDHEAFEMGIRLANEVGADILIGTDPDADRVGVVIKDKNGEYVSLTGNQIGALLTYYIASKKQSILKNDVLIKTIVTSDLGAEIAKSFGASVINTLTGFKFIGEKIKEFENQDLDFMFAYEESYGYLMGTFVRDKDAVIASMLIVEMAAYYKNNSKTLLDVMDEIYKKFGYYQDFLDSFIFEDLDGKKKIDSCVSMFRNYDSLNNSFDDIKIIEDYQAGTRTYNDLKNTEKIKLPKSNIVKIYFKDDSWLAIRPSGTEPKLKIYYSIKGNSKKTTSLRLELLRDIVKGIIR